jgi:hypothetical protein
MKLFPNRRVTSHPTTGRAFTITEMMFTCAIMTVVVGATVSIQLLGLRMYTLAATKLTSTASGRHAMDVIRTQIRQAKTLQVGNCTVPGDPTSFVADSIATNAQGNALQIYPTNAPSPFTIFYLDTSTPTNKLQMYTVTLHYDATGTNVTGSNTTKVLLVSYITNLVVFDAEDYNGNMLTNDPRNNRVYGVTLQFYQWEYPVAAVGNGNMYDFYQLRTRATRRMID